MAAEIGLVVDVALAVGYRLAWPWGRASGGKAGLPVGEHLLGVVEPLGEIAAEAAAEEGGQRLAGAGIEEVGVDGDLVVDLRGIAAAIAKAGQGAGGHLVERGGNRIPLGEVVVAGRGRPQRQEGVEIAGGAGADVVSRRGNQREVEEHQLQRIVGATAADRDVVGLDVAVGDSQPVEDGGHADQVGPKPLEEFGVEPALLPQAAAQGFDATARAVGIGRPHQEALKHADLRGVDILHDPLVAVAGELLEHLGLGPHPLVVFGGGGGFEDELRGRLLIATIAAADE